MDMLIQQGLREQLQHPLPGTGRPLGVEVFLDGGTVGQYDPGVGTRPSTSAWHIAFPLRPPRPWPLSML